MSLVVVAELLEELLLDEELDELELPEDEELLDELELLLDEELELSVDVVVSTISVLHDTTSIAAMTRIIAVITITMTDFLSMFSVSFTNQMPCFNRLLRGRLQLHILFIHTTHFFTKGEKKSVA